MPKLKTHKGAKSRFSITGNGKLMRVKCGKSHFRRRKAARTKRMYDSMMPTSKADSARIKRLLPYS
ncbi:50S ribosomal protein L35 [Chloroflexota bacterium]